MNAGISVSADDEFYEIPLNRFNPVSAVIYMYTDVGSEVPIGMHVLKVQGCPDSRGIVFLDDPEHLHHDFATLVMPAGANDYFHDDTQYLPFSQELLLNIQSGGVPSETCAYYEKCASLKCIPLTFYHVPHILILGEIDVSQLAVVKWSDIPS